jgi:molybdopterin-binding protein
MTWSGTGYRLFGVREAGSMALLDAKVVELDGSDFSTTVTAQAAQGYVVTSAIANSSAYVLAVARPVGTHVPREVRVKGAVGPQLDGEAAAFGAAGMIIETVAAAGSVFTLFGSSAR